MKVLEKTATLGEMTFKVQTNRDIAVKTFEEFPDLMEYLINQEARGKQNDTQFFINAIKNKELGMLFNMDEKLCELIKFALPMMLESAKDTTSANEIIEYAKENGVQETFNAAMLEFLVQGFTQREQAKPKIQFSMK